MYLSVPIPGSQDRTIELYFIPLDPTRNMQKIRVTLLKSSTIQTLKAKIGEKVGVAQENISIVDVWKSEIYSVYNSGDVGTLKESDDIYVYELESSENLASQSVSTNLSEERMDESEEIVKNNEESDIIIEVVFKKDRSGFTGRYSTMHGADHSFTTPLMMRISSTLSVYDFRKLLEERLHWVLDKNLYIEDLTKQREKQAENDEIWSDENNSDFPPLTSTLTEEENKTKRKSYAEQTNIPINFVDEKKEVTKADDKNPLKECPNMSYESIDDGTKKKISESTPPFDEKKENNILMRNIPMTYHRKTSMNTYAKPPSRPLGALKRIENSTTRLKLAVPTDEMETESVADIVGNNGRVNLLWSSNMLKYFDTDIWQALDASSTDIENVLHKKKMEPITLQKCIDDYCKKEQLEESEKWYCSNCKTHVRAWKQFHLYSTPPILIVHLKRFYFSSASHRRDKIGAFIDFPLNGLDLRDRVMNWKKNEEPIYDCYAVSNHYGGLGGGHYTAYAKNNGQWCYFDDSRVTEVTDEKEVVSEAAYVLYYRRRDLEDWDRTLTGSVGSSSPLSSSPSSSPPVADLSIFSPDTVLPTSIPSAYSEEMEVQDKEMESVSSANVTQTSCGSPIDSSCEDEEYDSNVLDINSTSQMIK